MDEPKPAGFDPTRILTYASLLSVAFIVAAIVVIIGFQIYNKGTASTDTWSAFMLVLGFVLGKAGDIYNSRFKGSAP